MAKSFSKRMSARGRNVVTNAEKIIKRAALAAASEAIMRTPVKTGKARVNWRVGFNRVPTSVAEGPNSASLSANANIAAAEALINAANKIKAWRAGKGNIVIGNPVSYIFDLDRGTSRQALSGMTIFAIAVAKDILRKGKLLKSGR